MTPGLLATEFEQRRQNLMKCLPEGSVVVSAGYSTRYMSNNVFYPFHQATDFWYLSGFNEPDSAMILGNNNHYTIPRNENLRAHWRHVEKNSSQRGYKQTMFVPPKSPKEELWDGPRTGIEGAIEVFAADEVSIQKELQDPQLLMLCIKGL